MTKMAPNPPEPVCTSCRKPKASLKHGYRCGICQNLLCKDCVQFLGDSFFSFLKSVPEELQFKSYCGPCYDDKVVPARRSYLGVMERARNVSVFYRKEKYVPILNRFKAKLIVNDCPDQKETILRLAFLAAEQSYNAIVEVDLVSEKVRTGGYQRLVWRATGYPAQVRNRNG